jgi:hypothetical protein
MSDSVPPVQMPDHEPTPARRTGQPIPPPKRLMPDGFGKPRSLDGLKPERFERKAYR